MNEHLQVCICGGGSLAHCLCAVIGSNASVKVNVLTRQPQKWKSQITAIYKNKLILRGQLNTISGDAQEVVPESDIIIFALPTFAHWETIEKIKDYLSPQTWIGAIPGWGGFDWQSRRILGTQAKIFGVHRVSHICRTLEYGASVGISGISPHLFVAGFPAHELKDLSARLEALLNISLIRLDNFLPVTLTPSNSVFHPVRLFSLFRNWKIGDSFSRIPMFYEEWDSLASDLFVRCDTELQAVCRNIPLDLSAVTPIFAHYGVANPDELTQRIRRIDALRRIQAPLKAVTDGFEPDLQSRFFTEDIPYGLMIIAGIARLAEVETPEIDFLIRWGQRLLRKTYLEADGSFGADVARLPLPQNLGIETLAELVKHSRF